MESLAGKAQRVTLCIVNFNGENHVSRTIPSLLESLPDFDEVLILDNASTDRSPVLLQTALPAARLVRLERNDGPGSARNVGFRTARNDRILFVDNDVSLKGTTLRPLMEALDAGPNTVLAVPRVLCRDDPEKIQYEGADCHFLGQMIPRRKGRDAISCPAGVESRNSLITCCFLIDRGRWGEEELFDESFFFNYEDHDLGVRARVFGHTILAVGRSEVFHGGGTAGLSFRAGGEYARRRVVCLIHGRWQVVLKNYSIRSMLLLSPAFLLFEMVLAAGALFRGWFREWWAALFALIRNGGHLLYRRRQIQSRRSVSDSCILQGGRLPFTVDLVRNPVGNRIRESVECLLQFYWRSVGRFL